MPAKRNKKAETDPWSTVPNFDEERDFPLIVEGEDSFGNKKRMYMDNNMKLVPVVEEKENILKNIVQSDLLTKKNSKNLFMKIDQYSNKENSLCDELKFSSPIVTNKLKSKEQLNTKKMVTVENIEDYKEDNERVENIFFDPTKTPEIKSNRLSDKMMFSSPLVGYTPSGKRQMLGNKRMLLEKLQKCKETPILSSNANIDKKTEDSLELFKTTHREVPKVKHVDCSSDLFSSAISSLDVSENNEKKSKSDTSEVPNEFIVPFPVLKEKSLQVINVEERKRWLQLAKRRSRLIKRRQGLSDSFWHIYHAQDSLSIIFKLCQVPNIQTFAKVFPPKTRKGIVKLGEGSFGEVFMMKNSDDEDIVVKFIPVESELEYNGAPMTKYDDVLSEIVIAKELSDLNMGRLNRCRNFVQMSVTNNVSITRGRFPSYFQAEWEKANKIKTSENDNPKNLGSQQEWIVLQFHFAGCPLEDFSLKTWREAYSILTQVALSLACAENHVEFEHRDLHLGNILVLKLNEDSTEETFLIDGRSISLQLSGVKATIIDFTFSRINKDENVVFVDLSKDKELFQGTGDLQFDVYRQMQEHNGDEWCVFNPKSNIFWLHFLGVKLREKLDLGNVKDDSFRREFEAFHSKILNSASVNHLIKENLDYM